MALKSQRYEISENLGHIVVISRKTAISAKNTICDTLALNSQRYENSEILGHTVVISRKRSNQLRTRFVILGH